MRRFLLIIAAVGTLAIAGAATANAAVPVQAVDWNHHHHVVVDRCYRPEVRYVRPQVVYYPQVIAPPGYATAPVIAAPPFVTTAPVVAGPSGFVSLSGRHFGIRFGF
jgi:hypothetical protein